MSLAESATRMGRMHAERLMTSECVIGDEVPGTVLNEETGEYDVEIVDPSYEGPCKIRFVSTVVSEVDAQSQLLVEQDAILSLPVDGSEQVRVQQVCRITANSLDAGMVGKRFRVTGDHTQTFATARRFPVQLVS